MQNKETINKIEALQKMAAKLTEEISMEIYSICEGLNYQDSSNFSYNIDRLEQFNNSLQDFKILNK